jgi:hypothetical protein
MQKSIRRGEPEIAQRAAFTLFKRLPPNVRFRG